MSRSPRGRLVLVRTKQRQSVAAETALDQDRIGPGPRVRLLDGGPQRANALGRGAETVTGGEVHDIIRRLDHQSHGDGFVAVDHDNAGIERGLGFAGSGDGEAASADRDGGAPLFSGLGRRLQGVVRWWPTGRLGGGATDRRHRSAVHPRRNPCRGRPRGSGLPRPRPRRRGDRPRRVGIVAISASRTRVRYQHSGVAEDECGSGAKGAAGRVGQGESRRRRGGRRRRRTSRGCPAVD